MKYVYETYKTTSLRSQWFVEGRFVCSPQDILHENYVGLHLKKVGNNSTI